MPPPGHQAPHPLQDPLYASPRPRTHTSPRCCLLMLACCCWRISRLICACRGADGRMRDALNQTGRPIVFYMCVQGQEQVQEWCAPPPHPPSWRVLPIARPSRERCGVRRGPSTGNLWRTTGDICGPGHGTWGGVIRNFYGDTLYPNSTMPGAWQDPDMLGAPACVPGPFAAASPLLSPLLSPPVVFRWLAFGLPCAVSSMPRGLILLLCWRDFDPCRC